MRFIASSTLDGRGVRAEVAAAVVGQLARPLDAREVVAEGDLDERVALVVLEPDVEARLVALDQVRLEEQRLADGVGQRVLDVDDAIDGGSMRVDSPAARLLLPVRRTRLRRLWALPTYSTHAAGVLHEVDAGLVGQLGEGGRELGGHRTIVRRKRGRDGRGPSLPLDAGSAIGYGPTMRPSTTGFTGECAVTYSWTTSSIRSPVNLTFVPWLKTV